MLPLSSRLASLGINLSGKITQDHIPGFTSYEKSEFDPLWVPSLVHQHAQIQFEYTVYRTQLGSRLNQLESVDSLESPHINDLVQELLFAYLLADIMDHYHSHYLASSQDAIPFKKDQLQLRDWLLHFNYLITLPASDIQAQITFGKRFRETYPQVNWWRLLFSRTKRLFDGLSRILPGCGRWYANHLSQMKAIGSGFNYISWCFYASRLIPNFFEMAVHLIPGFDRIMGRKAMQLSLPLRLNILWGRYWFELANDSLWFGVGLISAFFLIALLEPVAIYLSVALFFYDVILASIRAYVEISRMNELKQQYRGMIDHCVDADQIKEIQDYLDLLDRHFAYDYYRLGLNILTTSLLFLAMCLTVPLLVAMPAIQFVGLFLVLVIFIGNAVAEKQLQSYKVPTELPANNLPPPEHRERTEVSVATHGIFTPNRGRSRSLNDLSRPDNRPVEVIMLEPQY